MLKCYVLVILIFYWENELQIKWFGHFMWMFTSNGVDSSPVAIKTFQRLHFGSDSNLADVKPRSGHQSGCLLMNQSPVCWIVFLALPLKWQSLRTTAVRSFHIKAVSGALPAAVVSTGAADPPERRLRKPAFCVGRRERKLGWGKYWRGNWQSERQKYTPDRSPARHGTHTHTHHSLAHSVLLLNCKIKLSCL